MTTPGFRQRRRDDVLTPAAQTGSSMTRIDQGARDKLDGVDLGQTGPTRVL